MAFYQDIPWHQGEERMHETLRAPDMDNPTVPTMSPQLSNHLQIAPLIAIGTLDSEGRPWTTVWGNGDKGLARPLAQNIVGIKTAVTGRYDPVVEELVGKEATGEVVKEEGEGRMVSGLTIDLETRKRVKLYGRMVAGALIKREDEVTGHSESIAETQLVLRIEQSLGNCPKYLNSKQIIAATSRPELVSYSPQLSDEALSLLKKADLFFISSTQAQKDMDTNHRGGPAGFVRVLSNAPYGAEIVYPEYSGNRLYQTLGNLAVTPLAGICVPDFETGDMLYLTGRTDTLVGKDAAAVLPRSNLAVKVKITAARFVSTALPFRGIPGQTSPYNPKLRYLASEKPPTTSTTDQQTQCQTATLLSQTPLTPTISRFRFALANPSTHKAGQYVTLSFAEHLDIGYSHMRDDDPGSINDDFVRTFTVSSPPGDPPDPVRRLKDDEFEITVRKVGRVTEFLFAHEGSESGKRGMQDLEVGVLGFGGEFEVQQRDDKERICFVAAGVGITPLLPSLHTLDFERLSVLWAVRQRDLRLVGDVVGRFPGLARRVRVFVSGEHEGGSAEGIDGTREKGVDVQTRRMKKEDFEGVEHASRYYLCTPVPMRKQLEMWLEGRELIFEDFNF